MWILSNESYDPTQYDAIAEPLRRYTAVPKRLCQITT